MKSGKYSRADIALKFDQMYERIQVPPARELARPMWEQAKARLGGVCETPSNIAAAGIARRGCSR